MEGEEIPFRYKLSATDKPLQVLEQAVFGSIMESNWFLNIMSKGASIVNQLFADIGGAFTTPTVDPNTPSYPYETKVLQGIWAAAPYLHNGSVPTLADLLKPAAERPASFEVGNAYDPAKMGLAESQPQFNHYKIITTDCDSRNSGNSRCGHEFGTQLSADDKAALLEYLKSL